MKNKKVFIILVLIIAVFITGCGKKVKVEEKNAVADANCRVEGKHIHITDLSKEEQKELKIDFNSTILHTFADSKIKSVIFKGKTYDYKELVSLQKDFNKMVKFIVDNTDFIDEKSGNNEVTYVNEASVTKRLTKGSFGNIAGIFFVMKNADQIGKTVKKDTDSYIEVKWNYGSEAIKDDIIDSTYYGKSTSDEFIFCAGELRNKSEEFFVVLEDGRKIHMLHRYDETNWFLDKLIIKNGTYAEKTS